MWVTMFLKSMEIFGFKSFADRTRIEIEHGITVIVGPNGCGKSNIVDSVKWVLGEKQAKNIRGEKMEDVIFTGTEHRKFLSMAEVTLAIDNVARILKFDSDLVTVTRRVFRDGVSEYLINNSPVRLKDIEDLFLDTGIGKSSYSVMEQGRIDMILSSRAEDRRYIFEEAAGISRFKVQKKDSLRKLHDTGENIERINDIIREIEREKDVKAKQAEKTKVYIGLKDELKKNDVKIHILKNRDLARKKSKVTEQITRLKGEHDLLSKKIASVSDENERDEKFKNDIQLELFEEEKKLQTYKTRVEDIDEKKQKNEKLIDENIARKSALRLDTEDRNKALVQLNEEKNKTILHGEEIARKIEEDREQLKNFFESRKRKIETITKSRSTIEENTATIKEKEDSLKGLRDELEVVIRQLIDAIDRRKAEMTESEGERVSVRDSIHNRLKDYEGKLHEALRAINGGISEEASRVLASIDFTALKDEVVKFESFEDGFRSILFDKTGIHAKKEEIDRQITSRTAMIEKLRADNMLLEATIKSTQAELEDVNEMINRVEKDLSRNDNEKSWVEKHLESLARQISDLTRQIESLTQETGRVEKAIESFQNEIREWDSRMIEFNERSKSLVGKISDLSSQKGEIDKKIVSRKESSVQDTEQLSKLASRIADQDRLLVEYDFKLGQIDEYLWTEYEKKIADLSSVKVDELETDHINTDIQSLKRKIQDLGPINNLAIEEFTDLKKRWDYYLSQRKDIEKARADILSVIEEINRTSVELFIDTFKQIQKNFSEIFRQLFEGGSAEITLSDPDNVLESGIDVMVCPPGKKAKTINLLSGGERSMTAIALLFATYMVKPSPFCFLDEIDAALDEANVTRFLRMLKQFSQKTQFVMVTHNKKSMSVGSSIYGITMEEPGVSKVVSVRFERAEKAKLEQAPNQE
jgi:chromosome segregation protein